MSRVAVYGSLRKGGALHGNLATAKYLETCKDVHIPYKMYSICDWYPGLVRDPSGSPITFELYEVGSALLKTLDLVEGVPLLYERDWYQPMGCWIYAYVQDNPSESQLVTSGDWNQHMFSSISLDKEDIGSHT